VRAVWACVDVGVWTCVDESVGCVSTCVCAGCVWACVDVCVGCVGFVCVCVCRLCGVNVGVFVCV
jgi:hypothetical protein